MAYNDGRPPLSGPARLSQAAASLRRDIEETLKNGRLPLFVCDLDGTLVDHTLRTLMIFRRAPQAMELPEWLAAKLQGTDLSSFGYHPAQSLKKMGVAGEDLERLVAFWDKNFFANEFLPYDRPISKGVEFVNRLLEMGVGTVFLTGRDRQRMGQGTVDWLAKYGLLDRNKKTSLLMKEDLSLSNAEAKIVAIEKIRSLGRPLLIADNEPIELKKVWAEFPSAQGILLNTPFSGVYAELPEHTLVIEDFEGLVEELKQPRS